MSKRGHIIFPIKIHSSFSVTHASMKGKDSVPIHLATLVWNLRVILNSYPLQCPIYLVSHQDQIILSCNSKILLLLSTNHYFPWLLIIFVWITEKAFLPNLYDSRATISPVFSKGCGVKSVCVFKKKIWLGAFNVPVPSSFQYKV